MERRPKQRPSILPLIVIFLGFLLLVAAFLLWRGTGQAEVQPTAEPLAAPQIGELQPTLAIQPANPDPTLPPQPAGPTATPQNSAGQTPAIQLPRFDEPSFPDVTRVSLKDARAAYDQKTAIFVDVRGKDAYDLSHVTGALNIPLADIPNRANELDPHAWIITYCT